MAARRAQPEGGRHCGDTGGTSGDVSSDIISDIIIHIRCDVIGALGQPHSLGVFFRLRPL